MSPRVHALALNSYPARGQLVMGYDHADGWPLVAGMIACGEAMLARLESLGIDREAFLRELCADILSAGLAG